MQTVLQSSQDQAALLVSGQDYEQWIRHGSTADHPMDSASNMEEPAQGQSCHIALDLSSLVLSSCIASLFWNLHASLQDMSCCIFS